MLVRSTQERMRKVEVSEHNPRWKNEFESEAQLIRRALSSEIVAIHHIGSTSVPGIAAKPIIDILLEVRDVAALEAKATAMESLGYEVMGEFGIPGRRYFRKDDASGRRTHHVHAFAAGSSEAVRHLAFRDYLIAHPDDARAYSELKRSLAESYANDADAYMDGKDDFIKQIDQEAARWRQQPDQ
jgi:GrpB-like predicted nucleotidyltransferase (UPF0157 family)